MSVDPHRAPALALLTGHAQIGVEKTHTEDVPAGAAKPYVKVYIHVRYRGGDELPNRSRRAVMRIVTHSVGETALSAEAMAGNVSEALLDVVPAVPGRRCFPIRHEQSVPPDRDESTGELVMDQIDIWRLESVPA